MARLLLHCIRTRLDVAAFSYRATIGSLSVRNGPLNDAPRAGFMRTALSERRRPPRARPRPQYPARLPRCHDEQTRKPQQHATVVLPRIGARDARGIVGDEVAAHVVVERGEERPQARALEPFDNGLGI